MNYVSRDTICKLLKITPRWLNTLVRDYGMPRAERGQYDAAKCVHWYIAYLQQQIDEAKAGSATQQQAELRVTLAKAEQEEIKLAEKKGKIINVEEAQKLWERVIVAVKDNLLTLPAKLTSQFNLSLEQKSITEKEIRNILTDLANATIKTDDIRIEDFHEQKIKRKKKSKT